MFFRSNDYFKYLEKNNKQLKKENIKLKNELESVREYKNEYENLISQVDKQKEKYIELNEKLGNLISQCKHQLNQLK